MSAEIMPKIVRSLCFNFDAWIVNSGRDWDVIIPPEYWNKAATLLISEQITANSFGGWKIMFEDTTIDVWPSTINEYLLMCPSTYKVEIYHPKTKTILTRTFR